MKLQRPLQVARTALTGLVGISTLSGAAHQTANAGAVLSLEIPTVLEHFDSRPADVSKNDIHPPIVARFSFRTASVSGISGMWGGAHFGRLRGADEPIFGAAFGPVIYGGNFDFLFGLELESSRWVSANSRIGNTVLDNWRWAGVAGIEFRPPGAPMLTAAGRFRAITVTRADVALIEGQSTKADYGLTLSFSPSLRLALPFIKAEGGLDLYRMGDAAIASKDFATKLESEFLVRYHLGAGVALGPVEAWIKGALLSGVSDGIEHTYRSAYLYNDYLLAPKTAAIELRFNL